MLPRTRRLIYRSLSDAGGSGAPTHALAGARGRTSPANSGMVLAIVMIVATLILVALTAVLPSVFQEGQREREKETIFRGYQYARAVALFHKQFNRYPVSVKELAQQTNGMRFLRQEYRDPLDPKGSGDSFTSTRRAYCWIPRISRSSTRITPTIPITLPESAKVRPRIQILCSAVTPPSADRIPPDSNSARVPSVCRGAWVAWA